MFQRRCCCCKIFLSNIFTKNYTSNFGEHDFLIDCVNRKSYTNWSNWFCSVFLILFCVFSPVNCGFCSFSELLCSIFARKTGNGLLRDEFCFMILVWFLYNFCMIILWFFEYRRFQSAVLIYNWEELSQTQTTRVIFQLLQPLTQSSFFDFDNLDFCKILILHLVYDTPRF